MYFAIQTQLSFVKARKVQFRCHNPDLGSKPIFFGRHDQTPRGCRPSQKNERESHMTTKNCVVEGLDFRFHSGIEA